VVYDSLSLTGDNVKAKVKVKYLIYP